MNTTMLRTRSFYDAVAVLSMVNAATNSHTPITALVQLSHSSRSAPVARMGAKVPTVARRRRRSTEGLGRCSQNPGSDDQPKASNDVEAAQPRDEVMQVQPWWRRRPKTVPMG